MPIDISNIETPEFHLVWKAGSGTIVHRHRNANSAINEATRLSVKHKNENFYVLKPVAKVVYEPAITLDTTMTFREWTSMPIRQKLRLVEQLEKEPK